MPEAVIVLRSPIGRAMKGSLVGMRPDDWPSRWCAPRSTGSALNPIRSTDLMMGCGRARRGESSFKHRPVSSPSRSAMTSLPGTTVNQYAERRAQTTRMAFHAIKAGEGRRSKPSPGSPKLRLLADTEPAVRQIQERSAAAPAPTDNVPPIGCGHLCAMGQTAENVAIAPTGISREEQDAGACAAREPGRRGVNGFFEREMRRVTTSGRHHGQHRRPATGYHLQVQRAQAGFPAGWRREPRVPCRQLTGRRGGDHQRHQGQVEATPLARMCPQGRWAVEIMGRADQASRRR